MEADEGRKVFLEVRDPAALVEDLVSGRGLFVPTRLPLALNTVFLLGVRLRDVSRSVELPMIVVGRRVPRSGSSLLSAGVVAQLADPASPLFALLREVAAGKVVDLEARIQEQLRAPAKALFASTAEAEIELRALLAQAAQMPVDRLVQRGDRLALSVSSVNDGKLLTVGVSVKSVTNVDGARAALVELIDDKDRALVERFVERGRGKSARA